MNFPTRMGLKLEMIMLFINLILYLKVKHN
ncbi:MAG: hypothetical protein ACI9CZ_001048 [Flavobacterium sp.]